MGRIYQEKINWISGQRLESKKILKALGARNLTSLFAINIDNVDLSKGIKKKDRTESYSKMVQYNSEEADFYACKWIDEMYSKYQHCYIEFYK